MLKQGFVFFSSYHHWGRKAEQIPKWLTLNVSTLWFTRVILLKEGCQSLFTERCLERGLCIILLWSFPTSCCCCLSRSESSLVSQKICGDSKIHPKRYCLWVVRCVEQLLVQSLWETNMLEVLSGIVSHNKLHFLINYARNDFALVLREKKKVLGYIQPSSSNTSKR